MTILDLYREWTGIEPKKASTTSGSEYHGPCPICGGTDRFRLQPNRAGKRCTGFYACRQCKKANDKDFAGDTISFCMDVMGMNTEQAYERSNARRPEKPLIRLANERSFTPDTIAPPSLQWQKQAASFVEWSHMQIFKQPKVLQALEKRGLPLEAVLEYKIGWCSENNPEKYCQRADWDLEPEVNDKGELKNLWLPVGLVIPTIEKNGSVVRLKIRRRDWKLDDIFPKYVAISGSMKGLSIIGNTSHNFMIIVESELDAYAIDFFCSDFVFSVAVGGLNKKPDNVTDYLAKKKELLICYDNDGEKGLSMYHDWHKLYPHASKFPTPIGKDIGEAIQQGLDLREWVIEKLNLRF